MTSTVSSVQSGALPREFVPTIGRLVERQRSLAEIGADEAALLARDVDRSALASAMLSLSQTIGAGAAGIDPER